MEFQFSFFPCISLVTASFLIVLGVVALRLSRGRFLALWMFAMAEWALLDFFQLSALGARAKVFWSIFEYIGTLYSPVCYLLFALEFNHLQEKITPRNVAALCIVPTITLLLAATNEWHHWVWTDFIPTPEPSILIFGRGIAWVIGVMLYGYLVSAAATLLIGWSLLHFPSPYKAQSIVLFASTLLPWGANFLNLAQLQPVPGWDPTPASFAFTGMAFAYNLFKNRFYDVRPVARDMLVEKMPSAILALDERDRIVDYNPSALQLFHISGKTCVGSRISNLFTDWADILAQAGGAREFRLELENRPFAEKCIEINLSPLQYPNGNLAGRLLVIRDITQRKQAERERERLLKELQQARNEVQTLSGLLPICSHCKKIKDDSGNWDALELYLEKRSGAIISHGLCPDCVNELYPDYAE